MLVSRMTHNWLKQVQYMQLLPSCLLILLEFPGHISRGPVRFMSCEQCVFTPKQHVPTTFPCTSIQIIVHYCNRGDWVFVFSDTMDLFRPRRNPFASTNAPGTDTNIQNRIRSHSLTHIHTYIESGREEKIEEWCIHTQLFEITVRKLLLSMSHNWKCSHAYVFTGTHTLSLPQNDIASHGRQQETSKHGRLHLLLNAVSR